VRIFLTAVVLAVGSSAAAQTVSGTFGGPTSNSEFYTNNAGAFVLSGSSPAGPFTGTVTYNATAAVDLDASDNRAEYVVPGVMTVTNNGNTQSTSNSLRIVATLGGSLADSLKISDANGFSPGPNLQQQTFALSFDSLPGATYNPGDNVLTLPLNMTGLSGGHLDITQFPFGGGNPLTTAGTAYRGTVSDFALTAVPEPSALLLAGVASAGLAIRRRRPALAPTP
jgi:hypothetical protein